MNTAVITSSDEKFMSFKSFNWKFNIFIAFSAYTCKIGDGNGHRELKLSGRYTKENCITAVREQHPTANGATMDAGFKCYAEFEMTGWNSLSGYQSCMFFIKSWNFKQKNFYTSKGNFFFTFYNNRPKELFINIHWINPFFREPKNWKNIVFVFSF